MVLTHPVGRGPDPDDVLLVDAHLEAGGTELSVARTVARWTPHRILTLVLTAVVTDHTLHVVSFGSKGRYS